MYSINNSNSEQNYIYCRNDCGARITFSNNAISRNGRKIPLQENGLPHNCPKSRFHRERHESQASTEFLKGIENTEHQATIVPPGGHSGSDPKYEQNSDNVSLKLTPEQQIFVDTIGPAIVEILSLVQEIYKHTIQETRMNE
jgi:hypothetical protein